VVDGILILKEYGIEFARSTFRKYPRGNLTSARHGDDLNVGGATIHTIVALTRGDDKEVRV
jgi:hypothetical protein